MILPGPARAPKLKNFAHPALTMPNSKLRNHDAKT